MNLLRKAFHGTTACVLLGTCILLAATIHAQDQAPIAPSSATGQAATPTWTRQQLITSTVHQAWIMSGRNEATFFEMVTELAGISAANRGVTLPNTKEAGEQMGEYIKSAAKADTSQLLYDVVDKAVMMEAHQSPTPAGTTSGDTDQH